MDKTLECKIIKIEENVKNDVNEFLVCEYPLTIFLNKMKIATLFCSPENLIELTLGFLMTEQFITRSEDIIKFDLDEKKGMAEVEVDESVISMKNFHCKKVELQSLDSNKCNSIPNFFDSINCKPVESKVVLSFEKVYEFMKENLDYSEVFKKTSGAHSVALCDEKKTIVICEDVARHNALDKVIGKSIKNNIFLKDKIIVISGRVSLEMILKAAKMQIPIVISKSAPTSLSVALAKKLNITLIGFVRGRNMNIYSNEQRIKY
ncbi:formate dehydrogenase accessory sulfurtransferase FdhD [Clostridium thailandense]|uniref:formate dehydrogenase accessory sulfurtransferase FdhD n=1 Tax=Clostridium thailandense TaxID=2794346 RepID=UPI00398A3D09